MLATGKWQMANGKWQMLMLGKAKMLGGVVTSWLVILD